MICNGSNHIRQILWQTCDCDGSASFTADVLFTQNGRRTMAKCLMHIAFQFKRHCNRHSMWSFSNNSGKFCSMVQSKETWSQYRNKIALQKDETITGKIFAVNLGFSGLKRTVQCPDWLFLIQEDVFRNLLSVSVFTSSSVWIQQYIDLKLNVPFSK